MPIVRGEGLECLLEGGVIQVNRVDGTPGEGPHSQRAPSRYYDHTKRTDRVEVAKYEAVETLRDGRQATIRALRPGDRDGLLEAVAGSSTQSLYRRFFSPKRAFTEGEIAFFVNIDFITHVALVAVVEESGRPMIVGGGRYIVVEPEKAEVAFAVVDQNQGQGIGAALLHHLAAIARNAGLQELIAEVLPDNTPMLKVFEKGGFGLGMKREPGVVHVTLRLF